MKWMEFIKVRTPWAEESEQGAEVLKRMAALLESPGLKVAEPYTHAIIPGDLCLILSWETDQPQPEGSELGLRMVKELKRSGLVDYSVWIKNE